MSDEQRWVVFHSDERQGENYVNGPFETRDAAWAWASRFARDKAAEYSMEYDESPNEFAWVATGKEEDSEVVMEVTVMELIKPYD